MSSMFLPMIVKPTRITKNTATLAYRQYIFTKESKGTHLNGILFNDLSDHLPVFSVSKMKS